MLDLSMRGKNAVLTVAEMSEADRLSVAYGTSDITLMENAGRAVAHEIMQRWSPRNIMVLCGPGNNGGDGFVAARRLAEAGWPVSLAMLGTSNQLHGAAAYHASLWRQPIEQMGCDSLGGAELVVDALFGAGLNRPLEGIAAAVLLAAAEQKLNIISIDVPSGMMGDTGQNTGAVAARLTVTFFRKKPGHLLQPGRGLCGELVVSDIGTPADIFDQIKPKTHENSPELWASELCAPETNDNKYMRGHALLVGGYPATGASRMAARAAARSGAGLTTIAVSEKALPVYAAALTSIMVSAIADIDDLKILLNDQRYTGLLIGPGAGITAATRLQVLAFLKTGRPTVLDADALTVFRDCPDELFAAIQGPCVLTPHDGEFARLFNISGDKLVRTVAAARLSGAIIIHKGSDTVIAAPDGRAIINANAPPTLATAGAGDVLSGIVLGLLSQGLDAFQAAAAATWLHGAAANLFGPKLIAEDLPDLLPRIFEQLQCQSLNENLLYQNCVATINM